MLPLRSLFPFLLLLLGVVAGCGGEADDPSTERAASGTPPATCSEASPTEARLEFPDGEIGALAVQNGELFVGARSLRMDEKGALWRVGFDGRPARQLSSGYVGGPIHVIGGSVLHAEPTDAAANGHIVITSFDGTRRVVDGPPLILGEFAVVRDRAFFFARQAGERAIALWSHDSVDPKATVVRVADATGGGLFSSGEELLQGTSDAEARMAIVRRFDRDRGTFVDITTFPVFERSVIGADARELYLHDARTRTIVTVDLFSGQDTRTLGRDLDPSGGAYLSDDAVYIFQPSTRELVRIAKATGEAKTVAKFPESPFLTSFASDACYVYAAIDGMRKIARVPRGR